MRRTCAPPRAIDPGYDREPGMTMRAAWGFALALVACSNAGDRGDDFGGPCTPGTTVPCTCPNGSMAVATCGPDAVFGACPCPSGTGTTGTDDGNDTTASSAEVSTSADDTVGTTSCTDMPRYAGLVADQPSAWSEGAQTGLAAGDAKCQGVGGDHVCTYEELVLARDAGELAAIEPGTTAWVHRTTIESVGGEPSAPGVGGRCVDWTYAMDMLADGEYVEFTADGPTFVLDPDTFYDGLDTSHADPADLPCAGILRAIVCCRAACE